MKYGIIDVGTNTIRSVIYNDSLKPVDELVFESKILQYTKNSILSDEGINALGEAIGKSIAFFISQNVSKTYCFATSAMRDVKNFTKVRDTIADLGIGIDLLSEADEALCDFAVLKNSLGNNCSGAGFDLGGGSCQILTFENGELEFFCSEKIGVKRLLTKFSALTKENEPAVRSFIREKISAVPKKPTPTLFSMGGTPKKIRKLLSALHNETLVTPKSLNLLLCDYYCNNPQYTKMSATEFSKIPYGILVLDELCRHFSSDTVTVTAFGSRDGYLLNKINNKGDF